MKIERLRVRELRLELKQVFEESCSRTEEQRFLLLEARVDGVTAWSECLAQAFPGFWPETVRTAEHLLRDFLWPIAREADWAHPDEVLPSFAPVRGHNMAKAAVEMAVRDAYARQRGVSIAGALGGPRERTVSGIALGVQDSPEKLLDRVAEELDRGYRRIKLKIKPGWDLDIVRRVRERFPDASLTVDGNGAYTLADEPLFRELDRLDLTTIEQPLAYDDLLDHAALQAGIETPIALDESVRSPADARKALAAGACRMIKIKPGRVGGLSAARDIARIAEEAGIPVWCGGMLESGVGRAYNLHLSSLRAFSLPGDLAASDRFFAEEIVEPPATVDPDGSIPIPTGPGFGFTVREDALPRHQVSEFTLER